MPYQTGTATDVADLLDKLRVFASANGWTVNTWLNGWLSLQSGSLYFNFMADTAVGSNARYAGPRVLVRGATGFDSAQSFTTQPGTSPEAEANDMAGPFAAYHFFVAADYIHVVVEVTAGIFTHFVAGLLQKAGAYTGGEYVDAVQWTTNASNGNPNYPEYSDNNLMFDQLTGYYSKEGYLHADIDGKTDNWFEFGTGGPAGNRARGVTRNSGASAGLLQALWERSPNTFNGVSPLLPIAVAVERSGALYSPAGVVKDLRLVNMAYLTPGQTLTIGSDQWLCFPARQKTDVWNQSGSNVPSSGYYGYAYRKVP